MKVTVVLPSLNPDEKLLPVVQGLLGRGFSRILVVDDGSDPRCAPCFEQVAALPGCVVLHHAKNLGKGRALKTAFNYFLCHPGQDVGVVTVDGDGQHHPDDVAACARLLQQHPESVVLGCRDFSGPDVPGRSRLGNRSASFLLRLLAGLQVGDTQTGLRAIPTRWVRQWVDLPGERFEYETNMLLDISRWAVPLLQQPIRTIYLEQNATSHFRPLRDTWRIARLLVRFGLASGLCLGVDLLAFWLLKGALAPLSWGWRLLWATAGARLLSSLLNFALNRQAVFARGDAPLPGQLARYYALCILQGALSYGGVYLLTLLTGGRFALLCKIAADGVLFLLSFQLQRTWVFGRRPRPGREG